MRQPPTALALCGGLGRSTPTHASGSTMAPCPTGDLNRTATAAALRPGPDVLSAGGTGESGSGPPLSPSPNLEPSQGTRVDGGTGNAAAGGGTDDDDDATLGAGATAGIVIGVLALLALAAALVFAVVRWREENYPRMTSINTVTYASSQTQHNPLYNRDGSVKEAGDRSLRSGSIAATLAGADKIGAHAPVLPFLRVPGGLIESPMPFACWPRAPTPAVRFPILTEPSSTRP